MYAAFTLLGLRVLLGHEGAVIRATRSSIRLGIRVNIIYGVNIRDIVVFEMNATFGISTRGKNIVIS